MRKGKVVKMALTQPHHGPDGEVLHQPGELFDEGDALIAALPEGSFRPVVVDEAADEADKAESKAESKADDKPAGGDAGGKQPAGVRKTTS